MFLNPLLLPLANCLLSSRPSEWRQPGGPSHLRGQICCTIAKLVNWGTIKTGDFPFLGMSHSTKAGGPTQIQ